jgi:hypothetical protein
MVLRWLYNGPRRSFTDLGEAVIQGKGLLCWLKPNCCGVAIAGDCRDSDRKL